MFLIHFLTCKNITKQSKMHQETHSNFLGIFVRKLKRTGVQITRIGVCIVTNSRKTIKETQSPRL